MVVYLRPGFCWGGEDLKPYVENESLSANRIIDAKRENRRLINPLEKMEFSGLSILLVSTASLNQNAQLWNSKPPQINGKAPRKISFFDRSIGQLWTLTGRTVHNLRAFSR